MNYKNYNEIETMMCNMIAEGNQEVWASLEMIKNPLERCYQRKLYAQAFKILNNNKL